MRPDTAVGEVLSVEALALSSGVDGAVFEGPNWEILSIAERASGPGVIAHLWITGCFDGAWVTLTRVEEKALSDSDTRAASFVLPSETAFRCRVTLMLELAALGL
ncbi:TPA: hypothetical protein HA259_04215 [Thermoplasmata archaeon]|nr:hypothetical protein [Thermoplasmata archaeon]